MPPKAKKRKWFDEYVKFGFTRVTESDGTEKPKCMNCSKIFCNANMKPCRLKEHFVDIHNGDPDNRENLARFQARRAR